MFVTIILEHQCSRATTPWRTRKLPILGPQGVIAPTASQGSGRCQNNQNARVVKKGRLLEIYPEKKEGEGLDPVSPYRPFKALKSLIRALRVL